MTISGTPSLVNLLAEVAYKNVQNQPKTENNAMNDAVNFQKVVKSSFNQFAKMSPEQILNHIKTFQNATSNIVNNANSAGTGASSLLNAIKHPLKESEDKIRKSLINEASLLDIVTSANEAKNIVMIMAEFKKGFFDSIEKTLSMQV